MFWANGTRIPAIAEAMSVNRLIKLNNFYIAMTMQKWYQKEILLL